MEGVLRNKRGRSGYVVRGDPRQLLLELLGEATRGPSFGELATEWLRGLSRVCPENEERDLYRLAELWKMGEQELLPARVDEVLLGLERLNYSPRTINRARSTGGLVVRWAQANGKWRGFNPFEVVRRRREVQRAYVTMGLSEVEKTINAAPGQDWRFLIWVAVMTGMRPGELAALERDDVDMTNGAIHVHRSHERSRTKTGKERLFAIPRCALRPLRFAMERPGRLVFPAKGGERRSRNARISEVFARILARAGVARPFRFYDLRHTSATLHRLAGADPLVIRLMLGHASRNLTDDLYSHLSIDYQKTELAKLCVCGACARS